VCGEKRYSHGFLLLSLEKTRRERESLFKKRIDLSMCTKETRKDILRSHFFLVWRDEMHTHTLIYTRSHTNASLSLQLAHLFTQSPGSSTILRMPKRLSSIWGRVSIELLMQSAWAQKDETELLLVRRGQCGVKLHLSFSLPQNLIIRFQHEHNLHREKGKQIGSS